LQHTTGDKILWVARFGWCHAVVGCQSPTSNANNQRLYSYVLGVLLNDHYGHVSDDLPSHA
jgi:hypothetical protein